MTNAIALLVADLLFTISLSRAHSLDVDVYLSRATIQNSLTIVLAGVYLVSIGVLARITDSLFPAHPLPLNAFLIFLSLTGLAAFLLSDRLRQKSRRFVTHHFRRPQYDYRNVWLKLTERTASLLDVHELSAAFCQIVSQALEVLSVDVWVVDETH